MRCLPLKASVGLIFFIILGASIVSVAQDSLPSWNEGDSKNAIISFVQAVTDSSGTEYVPPAERIAVFDNDGTLWSEKPVYFQLFFAIDRVNVLANEHPEWKTKQPFKAVLENDLETLVELGEKGLLDLIMASHANMTAEEFRQIVENWLETARHPTLDKPYTKLVYQPMLELLDYLRVNGFKTFIVSGGGIEFMRPWTEKVYGIPPEHVVGSSIVTRFEIQGEKPVLIREPKINFIDDKAGKPVGINQHIGRKPIFAFGNSDGDLQMLQWTTLNTSKKDLLALFTTLMTSVSLLMIRTVM